MSTIKSVGLGAGITEAQLKYHQTKRYQTTYRNLSAFFALKQKVQKSLKTPKMPDF